MSLYERHSDYWIGIDSDGCAMDTMDIKHRHCFGPALVKAWDLEKDRDQVLDLWNSISLFSQTRGLNRFKALIFALKEINQNIQTLEDFSALEEWVQTEVTLTNATLGIRIHNHDNPVLRKALAWSEEANACIERIPFDKKTPFKGVLEALKATQGLADVAVVSGANRKAVTDEWTVHKILPYVNHILAQDSGSTLTKISEMKKQGYDPDKMLMVGDTPSDLRAAHSNGIFFYPILVGHEESSWKKYTEIILPAFVEGKYKSIEDDYIRAFKENLGVV